MATAEVTPGEVSQFERPIWQPLLNLLGEEWVAQFMWMCEIQLSGGENLHAYKHIDTRRYIHISEAGRAYTYVDPGRYRSISALEAAALALPREAGCGARWDLDRRVGDRSQPNDDDILGS